MNEIMDLKNLHIVGNDIIKETLAESKISYEIDLGGGVFLSHGIRDSEPIAIIGNPEGAFGAVYFNDSDG